jgi:hypothetical protein
MLKDPELEILGLGAWEGRDRARNRFKSFLPSLLIHLMSRPSRRQVQQPAPLYAAVPQSPTRVNSQTGQPQPHIGGPRPVRSASASSSNRRSRQQNERSAIAMGVATGNIGAGYGPYSVCYFFKFQIGNLAGFTASIIRNKQQKV